MITWCNGVRWFVQESQLGTGAGADNTRKWSVLSPWCDVRGWDGESMAGGVVRAVTGKNVRLVPLRYPLRKKAFKG